MTTITKERAEIKSFITGFLSDPAHDNQSSDSLLANVFRIALASLEAEPVAVNDDMAYAFHHALSDSSLGADEVEEIKAGLRAAFANVTIQPEPVVPDEIEPDDSNTFDYVDGWNACRAAMLQSGNFRENKSSSTNNFREIAETSTNYPVIPSEVLSAILKVAKIRADFDDFDGDRRGIGDCLDEAEQELIVTINKYASQLAAEPIAPNDVREQTAIPQVPVTPDGWISCSERMPEIRQTVIGWNGYAVRQCVYTRNEYAKTQKGREPRFEILTGIWHGVTHWMPLPEPPQEVNRG
ncbi:DUF551 domain-containing protein [Escherichia coli]|nr:DUF551 domain-containing protein [Escherichia coli]ELI9385014.1 DUF551 domain-containing protein [Escherichia coli]ELT7415916.1 DUF551 domain-containing protein [Escherichia coli]MBW0062125.1 DUF551 domain-containing protein [Escherichia coli]MCN2152380.1 DUF551 domain-containing protein [Escherichia coli]MCN6444313.1 DUF551 domain-containing protein [Escherichia coli]